VGKTLAERHGAVAKALIIVATLAGCASRTLSEEPPWRCPDAWVEDSVLDGECLDATTLAGPTRFAYDCSVSEVSDLGTPIQRESVVPPCNHNTTPASSSNKPCWYIAPDPAACSSGSQLRFRIERSAPLSPDADVVSYCRACLD
jgi:hypothetical protein